jgi:hypothetical protein
MIVLSNYATVKRELDRRDAAIDKWVRDHAYAPDDIVIGDGHECESVPPSQNADLQALLDVARPGWREVFDG